MNGHLLNQYCRKDLKIFQTILGSYRGQYTLGIGEDSAGKGRFMLRVPDGVDHSIFPKTVEVNKELISVIVEGGYKQAVAL